MKAVLRIFLLSMLFVPVLASGQVRLNDITWDEKVIDFGEIPFDSKPIDLVFKFTNNGEGDFKIQIINSGCKCTVPEYPKTAIKPGGKGVVKVTFDPDGMGGEIDKPIEIFGNFIDGHKIILRVKGNIKINKPEIISQEFIPGQFGYLRFSDFNLFYGTVTNDRTETRDFTVINDFNLPLSLKNIEVSKDYVIVNSDKMTLQPGDTAHVSVTIDASKVNDLGELHDEVTFQTDDRFYKVKTVQLYFNVAQSFNDSKWAMRRAPKAQFSSTKIDLGEINEGGKASGTITITNAGKRDLKIMKILTHCSCTVVKDYPEVIRKGQSVNLTVQFDAIFKKGPQNKAITIFTNDPANPVTEIVISAIVLEYE